MGTLRNQTTTKQEKDGKNFRSLSKPSKKFSWKSDTLTGGRRQRCQSLHSTHTPNISCQSAVKNDVISHLSLSAAFALYITRLVSLLQLYSRQKFIVSGSHRNNLIFSGSFVFQISIIHLLVKPGNMSSLYSDAVVNFPVFFPDTIVQYLLVLA